MLKDTTENKMKLMKIWTDDSFRWTGRFKRKANNVSDLPKLQGCSGQVWFGPGVQVFFVLVQVVPSDPDFDFYSLVWSGFQ